MGAHPGLESGSKSFTTGPNRFKSLKSLQNRFELVIFFDFSPHLGDVWDKCRHLVLLEVKISDQYVNILSIVRGDAVTGARINIYRRPYGGGLPPNYR